MEEQEDEESSDDNISLPDLLDDPVINDPLEGTYFELFCFIWNTSSDTPNNISLTWAGIQI